MIRTFALAAAVMGGAAGLAGAGPLELYIDADYSINTDSAEAIELGVRTALDEVGYRLGGEEVSVVPMDHRGNVKRSRRTMERFVESDSALALIGGLHSPPYLTHRNYMNQNGILTLLPWSAGGPITRAAPGAENWIFRVSVDDFKSGEFFLRKAVEQGGCKAPGLALLDTGWGRDNFTTLLAALEARGMRAAAVAFFPVLVGRAAAETVADEIRATDADCVILVANTGNGERIINALHQRAPRLRVFSHWGILGAGFADHVSHDIRAAMQLRVLQTCGFKREAEGSPVLERALARAMPGATSLSDISAPTGFVHGYDLTRLLIAAAEQAAATPAWSGDIAARRAAVKKALEALQTPVQGILKTYDAPFGPYSPEAPDAHEALGEADLCMARFGKDGQLEDAE